MSFSTGRDRGDNSLHRSRLTKVDVNSLSDEEREWRQEVSKTARERVGGRNAARAVLTLMLV